MTPSGNNPSRLDLAAMERRSLLGPAPKKPSPLRTDITEEYLQDVERRTQISLQQTRELLDSTRASHQSLSQSLDEAWNAIGSLENTMRNAETHLNRPGRIQRLGNWAGTARKVAADRFKQGADYVSSIPLTQRICVLCVALLGLIAYIWNSIGIGRQWQAPTVYT
jgi:hypothetical protein